MTSSRAAVLREFGSSVSIETLTVADPMPGEVLVRTAACGVCHSDLNFKLGSRKLTELPAIMGHEVAGVVEAVGAGVSSVVAGDHVIACNAVGCGECRQCLRGRRHLCQDRRAWMKRPEGAQPRFTDGREAVDPFTDIGGFSEYLLLPAKATLKIAPDISLDHAALLGCATITGVGAVINTACVPPGATVAVFGCGGIGSSIIQGARLAGAERIIALDVVASKLEQARGFGATDTVDISAHDAVEAVLELTDGGVDYAFDAVGKVGVSAQAFAVLDQRGTAVLVGAPGETPLEIAPVDLMRERRIMGSLMGLSRFMIDAPYYLELYRQGRLDLEGMVSNRFPLEKLDDAFVAMESGHELRSMITF